MIRTSDIANLEPVAKVKSLIIDYAAAGNGASNDTTPVSNALAANTALFDNGDFLVTSYDNSKGVKLDGNIRVLKATANMNQQINSYADKYQRVFGEEYLSVVHKRLIAGSAIKVILSGDSTTTGDGSSSSFYHLDNILNRLTTGNYISGITYVNNGHGAKTTVDWLSTYIAADLALTPNVYVLRWGINDSWLGGTPEVNAANFLSRLDTGLSTVRGTTGFDYQNLVIILQSQNPTTDDDLNHQGQIFNELVNAGLRGLARKYQCVYQDIYGIFQDSVHGQDYLTAADGTRPNELIHPQDNLYIQIATRIFNLIFIEYYKGKPLVDNGWNGLTTTTALTYFKPGINYDFVLSSDGFPINGFLTTDKEVGVGIIRQTLTTYDATNAQMWVRTNYSGTWHNWLQVAAYAAPSFNDRQANPNNTDLPATYTTIGITYDFALTSNGFPINGFLVTDKSSGLFIKQQLTTYDHATDMWVRVGYNTTWQAWKQVVLV